MSSRVKTSYRKIKRIRTPVDDESKNTQTYEFFQKIIATSILLLKDEKDKLNYSTWLIRLNKEEKNLKTLHLIKILCISISNNHIYFIFTQPPPEDLNEIYLEADNTVEMIEYFRVNTIEKYKNQFTPAYLLQNSKSKRSAAVEADMLSYSLSKTSHYIVQSFYAISDYPIYAWYNPKSIEVPSNIDHNQWELYLTRFNLLKKKKENLSIKDKTCEDIMKKDQVPKEVASKFNWHPHSVLFTNNRPKKSAAFHDEDSNVLAQPVIQQQIDEAAFAIVHNKSFPGFKMLNPKAYYAALMPDPTYVFKMSGVRIKYNSISPCTFKSCTRQWVRAATDPKAICAAKKPKCSQDAGKTTGAGRQSCCAARPAVEAPSTCKRMMTLNTTEFGKPKAVDDGSARPVKAEAPCPGAENVEDVCCKSKCPKSCPVPVRDTKPKGPETSPRKAAYETRPKCPASVRETKPKCPPPAPAPAEQTCPREPACPPKPRPKCEPDASRAECPRAEKADEKRCGVVPPRCKSKGPPEETCARDAARETRTTKCGPDTTRAQCPETRGPADRSRCEPERAANTCAPRQPAAFESTRRTEREPCDGSRRKSIDPPNPGQRPSDDTTNYDWTMFSYEMSEQKQWEPAFNSTRKDSRPGSGNRSRHVRHEDDRWLADRTRGSRTGAETSAADRSAPRRSRGHGPGANSSGAAVGCGRPREEMSSVRETRDRSGCAGGLADGRIQDVSMPRTSFDRYERSRCSEPAECEFRERIQDVSMPEIEYETSCSSDGEGFLDDENDDGNC